MPRARDPNRDKAFEIYKEHEGNIANRRIAEMLNCPEKSISGWKSKDDWNGVLQTGKRSTPIKKPPKKSVKKEVEVERDVIYFDAEGEDGLNDRQRLFCMYYLKSYNQTMAAIKAGYAKDRAHITGSELVRNSKVAAEIRRIKSEQRKNIFIDSMDIIDKYIKIAFADVTDYLTFGQERVQLMGQFGPVTDDNGNPVMYDRDYVRPNESTDVDGTLITSIKQGRDGISIQLANKMEALKFLSNHLDLLNDREIKQLQAEKLRYEVDAIKKADSKKTANITIVDEWSEKNEE